MRRFSMPPPRKTGLLLVLVAAIVAGCGDSDPTSHEHPDELGHPPPAMVATWTFQSVTQNGTPASLADALDWDPAATSARLHVLLDGPYIYEEVNATGGQLSAESGWVFVDEEGPTIEFHVEFIDSGVVDERFTVTYTLVGSTLSLTREEAGSTFAYTLVK